MSFCVDCVERHRLYPIETAVYEELRLVEDRDRLLHWWMPSSREELEEMGQPITLSESMEATGEGPDHAVRSFALCGWVVA